MKQRDIIFYLFFQIALAFTLLMLFIMSAQASSNAHTHNQTVESGNHEFISQAEEHANYGEEVHQEEKDHDHQAEAPLAYLFYWGILILVMVIILIYFVYRRKNKQSEPMIPLAVFLVLFALAIYIIEIITPAFSGRLDLKTLRIIHEFHEAPDLGFLRFIYKFILGIFMTFFAFLNMDRKDSSKK